MIRFLSCAIALAFLSPFQPARAESPGWIPDAGIIDRVRLVRINREMRESKNNTVYFDFDRDTLDREARLRLRQQAAFIRERQNVRFAVTGHTDMVGDMAYNQALGLRRANRVLNELVRLGVDRRQLVAMVSMGERDPAVDVETRERLNRRVTTRVLIPSKVARRPETAGAAVARAASTPTSTTGTTPDSTVVASDTPTEPEPAAETTTAEKDRPGNSAEGTGRPDAGSGNGNEPSGDPAGSVGHNRGGDET